MTEELPDPGFRVITIIVKPGVDPEVDWTGFAPYEAKAVISRSFDIVDDEELDQDILKHTPPPEDDDAI